MNSSEKRKRRKAALYAKQQQLCVQCFLHWPLDQMRWEGTRLICIGCHSQGHAN